MALNRDQGLLRGIYGEALFMERLNKYNTDSFAVKCIIT